MDRDTAIKFVSAIDKVLGLPGFICEIAERKLEEGDFEYVVNGIVTYVKSLEKENGEER